MNQPVAASSNSKRAPEGAVKTRRFPSRVTREAGPRAARKRFST